MYLCYIDDSGAAAGRTYTGLLVPADNWADLLGPWLAHRKKPGGIDIGLELKANKLAKGRGEYVCDGTPGSMARRNASISAYEELLRILGGVEPLKLLTVGYGNSVQTLAYWAFVDALERWAEQEDEHVLVFLDGQQQSIDLNAFTESGAASAQAHVDAALRDAAPYRLRHRALKLQRRRVVEDPVMQDSRYNQLIQAADLVAYAAYQHIRVEGLTGLNFPGDPVVRLAEAYKRLQSRWAVGEGVTDGILWARKFDDEDDVLLSLSGGGPGGPMGKP